MLSNEHLADYKSTVNSFVKDDAQPTVSLWDCQWSYVTDSYPLLWMNTILPEYLQTPCIYIHGFPTTQVKSQKTRASSAPRTPDSVDRRRRVSDAEVEGSPLKMQYLVDLGGSAERNAKRTTSVVSDHYSELLGGVDVSISRLILSCYMLSRECLRQPSLVVLSKYSVVDRVICQVAQSRQNETHREIAALNITQEEGPTGFEERQTKFSTLMKNIYNRAKTSQATMKCAADYSLELPISQLEGATEESSLFDVGCPSWMTAKFVWKSCHSLMEKPPPDSTAFIKVMAVPGDIRNMCNFMFREHTFLKLLVDCLKSRTLCWLMDTKDVFLQKKIRQIFKDEMKYSTTNEPVKIHRADQQSEDIADTNDLNLAADDTVFNVMKNRELLLTEKLWTLLLGCSSLSDLVSCFECIFTEIKSSTNKDLSLLLNPSDRTIIAKMIRTDAISAPSLTESEPIKILIEMGFLKIFEDYKTLFIENGLANEHHLSYYTKTEGDFDERLDRLRKLHHCIEVITMLKQYVHLSTDMLTAMTRNVLNYYQTHDFDAKHEFTLPVKGNLLQKLSNLYQPTRWTLTVTCAVKGSASEHLSTVWIADNQSMFPHIPNDDTPSVDDLSYSYQYFKITEVRNKFPLKSENTNDQIQ